MKTYIQKRKHNYLIAFIITISIFLLIRNLFQKNLKVIDTEFSKICLKGLNGEISEEVKSKLLTSIFEKGHFLEIQFGIIILGFCFISFFIFNDEYKSKKDKFKLFVLFGALGWLVFAISQSRIDLDIELNPYNKDNYYISLLPFLPYLYFIYIHSVIGKKEDITEEISLQFNEKLDDLDKLLELGLITEVEFEKKKEEKIKSKIAK